MELEVCYGSLGSYIDVFGDGEDYYLHHDGTLHSTATREQYSNFEAGWWKTKEEAEQFLQDWLPQKDWITKEQVKWAAIVSGREAHTCSINHWKQIIVAGVNEYNKAKCENKVAINEDYCALCQRHRLKGSICTLKGIQCRDGCVEEWNKVWVDIKYDFKIDGAIELYNKLVETYNKNFGEVKMDNLESKITQVSEDIKLLEDEKKKLEAERKQKEQYVFQAGDVAISRYNCKRIIVSIDGQTTSFGVDGIQLGNGEGQKHFENFGYKKTGRLINMLL